MFLSFDNIGVCRQIYNRIIAIRIVKVNQKSVFLKEFFGMNFPHTAWHTKSELDRKEVCAVERKNKKKPSQKAIEKISEVTDEIADIWNGFDNDTTNADVLGSYRGNPTDNTENPVQDADDL